MVPENSWFDLKFTEQLPADKVQELWLNVPRPEFEAVTETVPVGVILVPTPGSETVTVQVAVLPAVIDDGVHATVVEELRIVDFVNDIAPETRVK